MSKRHRLMVNLTEKGQCVVFGLLISLHDLLQHGALLGVYSNNKSGVHHVFTEYQKMNDESHRQNNMVYIY